MLCLQNFKNFMRKELYYLMCYLHDSTSLRLKTKILTLKVNESRCKQCGITSHFSTGQNLWKKILTLYYDIINQEKLFNRSTRHK